MTWGVVAFGVLRCGSLTCGPNNLAGRLVSESEIFALSTYLMDLNLKSNSNVYDMVDRHTTSFI
jgi:DNA-binding protein Fis